MTHVHTATLGEHSAHVVTAPPLPIAALLLYDTLLTLPGEIELLWQRKSTFSSFFYCITRVSATLFLLGTVVADHLDVIEVLVFSTDCSPTDTVFSSVYDSRVTSSAR